MELEDLGNVTEAITQWLKNEKVEALVLTLPNRNGSLLVKAFDGEVLREIETVNVKVRLKDQGISTAEAKTQIILKRA